MIADYPGEPAATVTKSMRTAAASLCRVGDKPGIYFFSLDANSRLAVAGARRTYRVPYFHSRIALIESDEEFRVGAPGSHPTARRLSSTVATGPSGSRSRVAKGPSSGGWRSDIASTRLMSEGSFSVERPTIHPGDCIPPALTSHETRWRPASRSA